MLKITNLEFGYVKHQLLFSDLSLAVKRGGICGLLGKNGAGKTTLLKIIAGLLFANAGECRVLGSEAKQRQVALLENIYFVPEEFYLPMLTAKDFIKLYAPLYRKFASDDFYRYAKEFELPCHQLLPNLSYGQKNSFFIYPQINFN